MLASKEGETRLESSPGIKPPANAGRQRLLRTRTLVGSALALTLSPVMVAAEQRPQPEQKPTTINIRQQVNEQGVVELLLSPGDKFTEQYRHLEFELQESLTGQSVKLWDSYYVDEFPGVVNISGQVKDSRPSDPDVIEIKNGEEYLLVAWDTLMQEPRQLRKKVIEVKVVTLNYPGQRVEEPDSRRVYPQRDGKVHEIPIHEVGEVTRIVKNGQLMWGWVSRGDGS